MAKNDGRLTDFNSVTDYAAAAKEWSEGNADLEKLLLTCFELRIAVRSSCAGHDKTNGPMILFENNARNAPVIKNILKKLYKSGYEFLLVADKFLVRDVDPIFSKNSADVFAALTNPQGYGRENAQTAIFAEIRNAILEPETKKSDLPKIMAEYIRIADAFSRRKYKDNFFHWKYRCEFGEFCFTLNVAETKTADRTKPTACWHAIRTLDENRAVKMLARMNLDDLCV
jgi:hypothetical protein